MKQPFKKESNDSNHQDHDEEIKLYEPDPIIEQKLSSILENMFEIEYEAIELIPEQKKNDSIQKNNKMNKTSANKKKSKNNNYETSPILDEQMPIDSPTQSSFPFMSTAGGDSTLEADVDMVDNKNITNQETHNVQEFKLFNFISKINLNPTIDFKKQERVYEFTMEEEQKLKDLFAQSIITLDDINLVHQWPFYEKPQWKKRVIDVPSKSSSTKTKNDGAARVNNNFDEQNESEQKQQDKNLKRKKPNKRKRIVLAMIKKGEIQKRKSPISDYHQFNHVSSRGGSFHSKTRYKLPIRSTRG